MAVSKSDFTFSIAISMEWCSLYVDCSFSTFPDCAAMDVNWLQTACLISLDEQYNFQTGL